MSETEETLEAKLEGVRAIIIQAFGRHLEGSSRGALVSGYYLARIRDLLRGDLLPELREPAPPEPGPHACPDCVELRARLTNIYHLTLNGGGDASTVRAIRSASGPGAPSPKGKPNA